MCCCWLLYRQLAAILTRHCELCLIAPLGDGANVLQLYSHHCNFVLLHQSCPTSMEHNSSCPPKFPVLMPSSASFLLTVCDAALLSECCPHQPPCSYEDLLILKTLIIFSSKISTTLQETWAKQIKLCQKEELPTDVKNKSGFQVCIKINKMDNPK